MSSQTSTDAAHKRWWQIFEVIFGIPSLIGVALQFLLPFSLPNAFRTPVAVAGGAALIVAGIVLVVRARREFAAHSQPTDPGHPTRKLVTTGVFSFSRNPLYLGGICILGGIALALNLLWVLVLLLPAIVACHYILIMPEEHYLTTKFGEEYRLYAGAVHRWVGRRSISSSHHTR